LPENNEEQKTVFVENYKFPNGALYTGFFNLNDFYKVK